RQVRIQLREELLALLSRHFEKLVTSRVRQALIRNDCALEIGRIRLNSQQVVGEIFGDDAQKSPRSLDSRYLGVSSTARYISTRKATHCHVVDNFHRPSGDKFIQQDLDINSRACNRNEFIEALSRRAGNRY